MSKENTIQQFYFYSHTDRRCLIQTEPNNKPAWKLKFIGELNKHEVNGVDRKKYKDYQDNYFLVTTNYGKNNKEKVESRQIKSLFDVVNWAGFIQSQNTKKVIKIYQIIKK